MGCCAAQERARENEAAYAQVEHEHAPSWGLPFAPCNLLLEFIRAKHTQAK
jgi:hypothetical protein